MSTNGIATLQKEKYLIMEKPLSGSTNQQLLLAPIQQLRKVERSDANLLAEECGYRFGTAYYLLNHRRQESPLLYRASHVDYCRYVVATFAAQEIINEREAAHYFRYFDDHQDDFRVLAFIRGWTRARGEV